MSTHTTPDRATQLADACDCPLHSLRPMSTPDGVYNCVVSGEVIAYHQGKLVARACNSQDVAAANLAHVTSVLAEYRDGTHNKPAAAPLLPPALYYSAGQWRRSRAVTIVAESDTTTPDRAAQLAQLADFLRSEAADRHEDAPALADQLMDLALQAEDASAASSIVRPSFTAGQMDTIRETTRALYRSQAPLPAVRYADRKRFVIWTTVERSRPDFLLVRSTIGGGIAVGYVAHNLQADRLINAFALAVQLEEQRLLPFEPTPAPASVAHTRRQVLNTMRDRAQHTAKRIAA